MRTLMAMVVATVVATVLTLPAHADPSTSPPPPIPGAIIPSRVVITPGPNFPDPSDADRPCLSCNYRPTPPAPDATLTSNSGQVGQFPDALIISGAHFLANHDIRVLVMQDKDVDNPLWSTDVTSDPSTGGIYIRTGCDTVTDGGVVVTAYAYDATVTPGGEPLPVRGGLNGYPYASNYLPVSVYHRKNGFQCHQ
jgi:hypothetical protein